MGGPRRKQRNEKSVDKAAVFFNVPYDAQYEDLFLALVAGLVSLGLTPHCVLEVPQGRDRLTRIFGLIKTCLYSIHDLSRVELSKGVPRFNMPFELGLCVALAIEDDRYQWRMFEAKAHRLDRSLSDLKGYDHLTHQNRPAAVLEGLRSWFPASDLPNAPLRDPNEMHAAFKELRRFRQEQLRKDIYNQGPFVALIAAARAIVEKRRVTSARP